MKYHMSCGCVIDKPARTRTNKRTCPDHPGSYVTARSIVCCDCGKEFKIPVLGGGHKRCPACAEIKNQENTVKSNAAKKAKRRYKQKITLVFECGCRYRSNQFKGPRICPKHNTHVSYRVSTCVQCGIEFRVKNLAGKAQLLCQGCIDKPIAANTPVKMKTDVSASIMRYDCAHRSDCLSQHMEDDFLPCAGCKKYVPETVSPVQVSRFDPEAWALGEAV